MEVSGTRACPPSGRDDPSAVILRASHAGKLRSLRMLLRRVSKDAAATDRASCFGTRASLSLALNSPSRPLSIVRAGGRSAPLPALRERRCPQRIAASAGNVAACAACCAMLGLPRLSHPALHRRAHPRTAHPAQRDPPRQHTSRYPPPSGLHHSHHRQRPRRRR